LVKGVCVTLNPREHENPPEDVMKYVVVGFSHVVVGFPIY